MNFTAGKVIALAYSSYPFRFNQEFALYRLLGGITLAEFRIHYEHLIQRTLAAEMVREPHWTQPISVGSRAFVDGIAQTVKHLQELEYSPLGESGWVLRETLAGDHAASCLK